MAPHRQLQAHASLALTTVPLSALVPPSLVSATTAALCHKILPLAQPARTERLASEASSAAFHPMEFSIVDTQPKSFKQLAWLRKFSSCFEFLSVSSQPGVGSLTGSQCGIFGVIFSISWVVSLHISRTRRRVLFCQAVHGNVRCRARL